MSRREAVITGIGVVAPAGIGVTDFWNGVQQERSFLTPLTSFPTDKFSSKVVGNVKDFHAADYLDSRIIAQTDRWTHFDLACAAQALTDARITLADEDATRVGAVFATGTGGNGFGQQQLHICSERGPKFVSAYLSIAWFYAASIGQVSIRHGIRGYGRNICAEAAGGLIAIAHATKIIAQGLCDVVLVGGSEAPLAPYAFAAHHASGLLSPERGDYPYRPFDATRSGTIVGEGGACFCIESYEHAKQRHAHIYASVGGSGQTFDGQMNREPAEDGKEYARAMTLALHKAHVQPEAIDWIVCDGLGTQSADIAEVRALHSVFGEALADIPASAPKSMIGRLFNGGSTVDVAMALLGMEEDIVLPTVGYSTPDEHCSLDCVPNVTRCHTVRSVLIGARGFGGFNAATVLRHPSTIQEG